MATASISTTPKAKSEAIAVLQPPTKSFGVALVAGGAAGTAVDLAFYPLDTLKTRLQSAKGFRGAGGFRGIFSGVSAAVIGSAPGASIFFTTYEATKKHVGFYFPSEEQAPFIHMGAASVAEMGACLVRVPTEIVKQRMQTGEYSAVSAAVRTIWKAERLPGFYVGYWSMLLREIPFALIQFPLWEKFKKMWAEKRGEQTLDPFRGAICGSVSGGIAAAFTTPFDVAKTRLMLVKDAHGVPYRSFFDVMQRVVQQEGPAKLFSGIGPRVTWISLGGFVFFGVYEKVSATLAKRNEEHRNALRM